jgi:cell division protein FtsQ
MRPADGKRLRILRRWTLAGIATVLVAMLAVAATYTPVFAAKDIRVRGSAGISRAEVLSLGRVDDRSNVFHLDTDAVERHLESDPRVLDARVTTSLPDTLSIEIVPRTPVAVMGTGVVGTHMVLVGADGVVIGPAGLGIDLPALRNGEGGPVHPEVLETAAATAGALGPALRRTVEAVVVASDGALKVRLAAGFSASFGDASELETKAASLSALLTWVEERGVTVISADLSVPGSPTAQLERGAAAVVVP